jgi:hypothetical protein
MGYIKHDAVVAVTNDYSRIGGKNTTALVVAFRETMSEECRRLLVGPVSGLVNGDDFWCFLPDGSKEDWETSDEGQSWRDAFRALLRANAPAEYVAVAFGGDLDAAIVEDSLALTEEDYIRRAGRS